MAREENIPNSIKELLKFQEVIKSPDAVDKLDAMNYQPDEGSPIGTEGTNVEDVMASDQGQGMGQGQGMASSPDPREALKAVPKDVDPSPAALQQMLAEQEMNQKQEQLTPNQDVHDMLFTATNTGDSIAAMATETLLKNAGLDIMGMIQAEEGGRLNRESGGGLMKLAAGGEFAGRVPGDGHGMEDNVFMPIQEGPEQVGTLAVSPTEYVVDSYTMAALGNGNPNEGADIMDQVVKNVRQRAYGTRQQPNEINGLAALRPMIERV
jgi:hypothetical protein